MFTARRVFMASSVQPPTITSFSPTSLANGTGNVTITGTNFTGATVTVGGTASTTTVNSPTSLTVAFPSLGRGTYAVVVTTPGGSASANFTYTVTPFISSISPSSVFYDYTGGYTISGGRFSSSGASSVYAAGNYYGISIANDGLLSFNPGALGVGNYSAQVTAPDGWSNAVSFSSVYYPAPSISSVSDGRGGNGVFAGTTVTLTGSNFARGTTTVSVAGTAVSATVSNTSISFSFPGLGNAEGSKTITVTTTGSNNQSASTSVYYWGLTGTGGVQTTYTSGSGTYSVPGWANFVDVVCMGGGGGGGYSNVGAWGGGGNAGAYGSTTINRASAGWPTSYSYTVGAGGLPYGGAVGTTNGGASTAAGVTGNGGTSGCNICNGPAGTSTAAISVSSRSFPQATGGGAGNSAQPGANPGSGGGGGNSGLGPFTGVGGRAGAVYFVARR